MGVQIHQPSIYKIFTLYFGAGLIDRFVATIRMNSQAVNRTMMSAENGLWVKLSP